MLVTLSTTGPLAVINHYAYSKGATDAWCLTGRIDRTLRGMFEMNRKTAMRCVVDGTSQTIAMSEADSSFSICHGPGCTQTVAGPDGERQEIQVWIAGVPSLDFLAAQDFLIASAYARTAEPMNKRPVTDTSITLSGLGDCRTSADQEVISQ